MPDWLGNLTALRWLNLGGNPLVSPPPEVMAQGGESVLAFLRANARASVTQWVSKMLVVGEGRVGKTSLVRAVAGQPHNPGEATTHGLLLSDLPVAHPSRPNTVMRLSVWDFGGQDIYHATHQFFLTDQSLFLLVWNAGEGTERSRLRYWLDIITARAPGAPILVVASHTADRPADITIATWQDDYPQIVGHHSIDCVTAAGIADLRTAIAQVAAGLPLMGVSWPRTWDSAATALAATGLPFVGVRQVWQTMYREGVADPVEQHALAMALHHRGQLLYYPYDDDLADTVVLDPQWLNIHISRVLDNHALKDHDGILTRTDLATAWPDLDRAQHEHLLTLMDRFDVSHRIREATDDAIAVVVTWLPTTPPDYTTAWDQATAASGSREIRVIYQLTVIPPGIPGWFLARSHRFATDLRWRTGALLRHPDHAHTGLIQTRGNEIELAVRGPLPAGFFSILDDGLNLTLDRYPGLSITRIVPCHTHGPCATRYDYNKLITWATQGRTSVFCPELDDKIDIATLLLGIAPTNRDLTGHDLHQLLHDGFAGIHRHLDDQDTRGQQDYIRLRTTIQRTQEAHCPSVFTLTRTKKTLFKTEHVLRLYCEEPGSWHPLPDDQGCYPISHLADWLRTAGRYLTRTLHLLKAAVPFVSPVLGLAAHQLQEQLKDDLALTQQILDTTSDQTERHNSGTWPLIAEGNELGPTRRAATDADFRMLRTMLEELDPTTSWGGLSLTTTPEGHTVYLCIQHRAQYQ